ncbi:MAG TPA: isoprenylcysteine carboxylmethyltransferase family protein [Bryobacteraceae bacterium]|nr:isoprenylcysteine carboxylmethyltransferase family protein [Bryobacteraceae bacterium]HPT24934.1 isoprenylcysteine carboxylmethyltransferase family protein [Bryobacteraceae bacterium]
MSRLFPRAYSTRVQRLRVPFGFLLAAIFLYLAQPTWLSLLLGLPLSAAGLALRSWAAGHLRKDESLVCSGPYAWTRNPLYLGTFLTALGCAIASNEPLVAAAVCALFILIYLPVMEQEEEHLQYLFPDYTSYAARVPLLLPKPPSIKSPLRYQGELWRRNKEWKAWYGFLAVEVFLLVQVLLSSGR